MNSQQRRVALRQEARKLNLYPHQIKVMRQLEAYLVDEPSKSFVDVVKGMQQHFRDPLIETPVLKDDL